MKISILKKIPGIGKAKEKIIMSHFNSITDIKNSTINDLKKIKNISHKNAVEIIKYLSSR